MNGIVEYFGNGKEDHQKMWIIHYPNHLTRQALWIRPRFVRYPSLLTVYNNEIMKFRTLLSLSITVSVDDDGSATLWPRNGVNNRN